MQCLTGWIAIVPEIVHMAADGIAYPEDKRPIRTQGNVVSVGPRVKGVERGDRVVFGGKSGDLFDIGKKKYIIIDHEAVFAVTTPKGENLLLQKDHFKEFPPEQHVKEVEE